MASSSQTIATPTARNGLLVIMAKAPKLGMVKTRLAASLPSSAVIALYRCLLKDTVALAKSLTGFDAAVMCPASDLEDLAHFIEGELEVVAQEGKGLAAGLTSVFQNFTTAGRHVVAFNSDSPHLAPSVLHRAFELLASHDVVVGPTEDGGYYLIGAKAAHPKLFEDDGLGTSSALERLLTRTKALELSTAFTETFYDVDVANDLIALQNELRVAPARAPRTAAWFADWEHVMAPLRKRSGAS